MTQGRNARPLIELGGRSHASRPVSETGNLGQSVASQAHEPGRTDLATFGY